MKRIEASSAIVIALLTLSASYWAHRADAQTPTLQSDNAVAVQPVVDDPGIVTIGWLPTTPPTPPPGISTTPDLHIYGPTGNIDPNDLRPRTPHISVSRKDLRGTPLTQHPNTIWGLQDTKTPPVFPAPLPAPGETVLSGLPSYFKYSEANNLERHPPVFPRDLNTIDAVIAADMHARDLIIANLHSEIAEAEAEFKLLGYRYGAIRFSTTPVHSALCQPVQGQPNYNPAPCPERGRDVERMTILNNGNVSIGMPPGPQVTSTGSIQSPPIPLARLVVEGDPHAGMVIETIDDKAKASILGDPPSSSKTSFGGIGLASEPGYDFVVGKRTDYDAPTTSYNTFFELRRQDGIPLITTDISGQTGIGTNKPASILHVQAADNPTIRLQNSWFDRGGLFEFWTAATPPAADWRSVTLKSVVDYNDDDPKVLKEGRFTIATNGTQGGTGLVEALSCANGKVLVGDYNPSSKPDRKLVVNGGNVAVIPEATKAPMISLLGETHWNIYNTDNLTGTSKFIIASGNLGGNNTLLPLPLADDDARYGSNDRRFFTIVRPSGFVGINNHQPDAMLHVKGGGTTSSSTAVNVTNSTGGTLMVVRDDGFVGIGTPSPHANDAYSVGYKLGVEGLIKAQEVRVSVLNWADFVFDDDYALLSLDSLSSFIKAEKRLPEMPSALTAIDQGIAVGEMHTKLVQKIEELTLYVIQLKEANTELARRLETLENGMR